MSQVDEIKKQYEIGQPIFEEIFSKSDKEVKEIIQSITDNDKDVKEILDNGIVTRVIKDEKPSEITIYFYDGLELNWLGLLYKPEHGSGNLLVKFNKHFKLC